jgi:hypothetical protein
MSNLYDSGKPQRIIVEREDVPLALSDGKCPRSPREKCSRLQLDRLLDCDYVRKMYGACGECPFRQPGMSPRTNVQDQEAIRKRGVTITPEFQVIDEPKRLK